jgi:hypothetical protein
MIPLGCENGRENPEDRPLMLQSWGRYARRFSLPTTGWNRQNRFENDPRPDGKFKKQPQ